jgi:hypothetical protein
MGVIAVVIALMIWVGVMVEKRPAWDMSYEMTNARISWRQTFHPHP